MLRPERLLVQLAAVLLLSAVAAASAAPRELTQDDVDFRKEIYIAKNGDRLPYRLFVPVGYDKTRQYPLLLWLHGSDGRGTDNQRQLTHQNQLAAHFWISKPVQAEFPVLVILPQCPSGQNWAEPEFNQLGESLKLAVEALEKIRREFSIDPDRIYIGGQSMGGLGVWALLQKYPDLWAGALVMSAYDNFTDVKAIARVPVWIFQGDADSSVPVNMVRQMVRDLKKANAIVRYSEYHNAKQDIWTQAYAEPDLVSWLSAQRRRPIGSSQLGSGTPPTNPQKYWDEPRISAH